METKCDGEKDTAALDMTLREFMGDDAERSLPGAPVVVSVSRASEPGRDLDITLEWSCDDAHGQPELGMVSAGWGDCAMEVFARLNHFERLLGMRVFERAVEERRREMGQRAGSGNGCPTGREGKKAMGWIIEDGAAEPQEEPDEGGVHINGLDITDPVQNEVAWRYCRARVIREKAALVEEILRVEAGMESRIEACISEELREAVLAAAELIDEENGEEELGDALNGVVSSQEADLRHEMETLGELKSLR